MKLTNFSLPSIAVLMIFPLAWLTASVEGGITVGNVAELRHELNTAKPGSTYLLAPGNYGPIWIEKISGDRNNPIVIEAADANNLPVFAGGSEGMHFSGCHFITLRNIRIKDCTANGINADDSGNLTSPSIGMIFENLIIENIGPQGNHDGLKLSGMRDFKVINSTFSGWGGSAIDMVGCQNGLIENCRFIGKEGFSQSSGVQVKGGSERIMIRQNNFRNAGQRAVNIGGSTGLQFFRPELRDFEARDIEVAGNYFFGSMSPIAYVTSINCVVRQNTIIFPDKWVIRILQEQPTDSFLACQGGVFESNLIVFDKRVQVFVNVGGHTKPETFVFRNNAWFCADADRRPTLPTPEINGIHQVDPLLENYESPIIKSQSVNPRLKNVGAHSFQK